MNIAYWRDRYERLVVVAAVTLLLASSTWAWNQRSVIAALKREPVAVRFSEMDHVALEGRAPETESANWMSPSSQSLGKEWRYEVFSPPAVYYQPANKQFVVALAAPEPRPGPSLELELVEVRRQPYRLQLTGSVGTSGDYVGMFRSDEESDTLLARRGDRIESLGIRVRAVEMTTMPCADADGRTMPEWAARAAVEDERTGEEVVLDDRTRRYTGRLIAIFRRRGEAAARPLEAGEDDTLHQGDSIYRITRLQFDPPEVRLERATTGREPEQLVLTPAGPARTVAPGSEGVRPWAADRPDRVATTDQPQ